jgi:hypothetical protein
MTEPTWKIGRIDVDGWSLGVEKKIGDQTHRSGIRLKSRGEVPVLEEIEQAKEDLTKWLRSLEYGGNAPA